MFTCKDRVLTIFIRDFVSAPLIDQASVTRSLNYTNHLKRIRSKYSLIKESVRF